LTRAVKLVDQALERVVGDFAAFRSVSMDPNLFVQYLIRNRGPNSEPFILDFNSLSFYATLFGWDSSLNFNSVIADPSNIEDWLKSNSISLVYSEGQFRVPPNVPVPDIQESASVAQVEEQLKETLAEG